jgi:hypothetical protein
VVPEQLFVKKHWLAPHVAPAGAADGMRAETVRMRASPSSLIRFMQSLLAKRRLEDPAP